MTIIQISSNVLCPHRIHPQDNTVIESEDQLLARTEG